MSEETITVERGTDGKFTAPVPQTYGAESVEQSQGYAPMGPDPTRPSELEENTFKSDADGLQQAADELKHKREEAAGRPFDPAVDAANKPVVEQARKYRNIVRDEQGNLLWGNETGWDPTQARKTGQPLKTVDLDRATEDLRAVRHAEDPSELEADFTLAEEVDAARENRAPRTVDQILTQAEQQQAQSEQPTPTPEPQQQTASPAEVTDAQLDEFAKQNNLDPAFTKAWVRAPQELRDSVSAAFQQQAQQYVQGVTDQAHLAAASFYAQFPELQGITDPAQMQGALHAIEKSNPQRAQQLVAHVNAVKHVAAQAQQAQQAYQQHQAYEAAQQKQQWFASQDAAFEQAIAKDGPNAVAKIQDELVEMAKEVGWSKEQLTYAFANEPGLRAAPVQLALYAMAKQRMLAKNIKPAKKAVPPVLKPGTRSEAGSDRGLEGAMRAFYENEAPTARDAAAALAARRRADARR